MTTRCVALLDAIQLGYVPGMHAVGEEFAHRRMFLPDRMASAEAMRSAMGVLELELIKLGAERPVPGVGILGTVLGGHPRHREDPGWNPPLRLWFSRA